jgi:hypothetical protein
MVANKKNHKFTLNPKARERAEFILKRTKEAYEELDSQEVSEDLVETGGNLLMLIHRMEKIICLEEAKEIYNKELYLSNNHKNILMDYMRGVHF